MDAYSDFPEGLGANPSPNLNDKEFSSDEAIERSRSRSRSRSRYLSREVQESLEAQDAKAAKKREATY